MTVADRIGFLPGLGWIAGQPFWLTLLICWAITPGMMIVIGLVFESRLIPLSPQKQYLGFFPGDLFLGAGVASGLEAAKWLPAEAAWYNQRWLHITAVAVAISVVIVMVRGEIKSGGHTVREITSPVGLYHSVALYGGYTYLAGTTAVAIVFGVDWSSSDVRPWGASVLLFISLFIILVSLDGVREFNRRASYIENPKPFWR